MATRKGQHKWAIWIGVWTGIYCLIYASIPWLYNFGVMPCTFIALPIYLTSGGKRSDYLSYCVSAVTGVLWGFLMMLCVGLLGKWIPGISDNINFLFVFGILTWICCAFHFCITDKTLFSKVTMMFGGIAITCLQGGAAEKLPGIMITLCLGISLGLLCQEGTNFISADGKWKVPQRNTSGRVADQE